MTTNHDPEVTTTAGVVRGLWREGSAAFLGIPFAQPPVGDLRFAAPVPPEDWSGVRDATAYGATPQRGASAEITLIPEPSVAGESTLNLNVFTPRPGEPDAALPVLVYIHGGGYISGSPASPWYDGAAFNRDGVVTVSVSYRLGFDGFGWIADAPHNRAILDWILALEWVRDNVAAFGGDPGRVTIAGQSAGGGAALTLLSTPRAAGLFQRAISLSGTTAHVPLPRAEQLGRALANAAGVTPTRAGLATLTEDDVLRLQQQVSAPIPIQREGDESNPLALLAAMTSGTPLSWAPVVDGDLLPESIEDAVAHGAGADKGLLLGATDHEFNQVVTDHREALAGIDPATVLAALGVSGPTAAAYLAGHRGLDPADVLAQYVTDAMFRARSWRIAELRAASGAPAWLYRFSWVSQSFGIAVHCVDVPFFFDCLDLDRVDYLAGAGPPRALADDVHGAAVAFVLGGDPGWPAYAPPERSVRVYDVPSSVRSDAYSDVAVVGSLRPAG